MALFTLSDITYKEQEARTIGPLPNELFGQKILRYPIDIGSVDKGHYMIIHINVQDKTEYTVSPAADTRATIHKNRALLAAQTGYTNIGGLAKEGLGLTKDLYNKLQSDLENSKAGPLAKKAIDGVAKGVAKAEEKANEFTNGLYGKAKEGLKAGGAYVASDIGSLNNATFLRKTTRTTDSIALYMPNTLNFNHSQQYSDLSLAGENLTTFGAVAKTMLEQGVNAEQKGRNLSPFVLQQLTKIAGTLTGSPNTTAAIFAGATGLTQNPQLELIYGKPDFRPFRFSFMFYPRSEREAEEVQKLIARLKFHQAPEIKNGTAGYFLVPPSEFDIEFYYNGQINKNIPRISTCVLLSIDLDYAPNGFHAFETPGDNSPKVGGTGMPTAIRMDLSFKETEIMTKFNFQDEAGAITKKQDQFGEPDF